MSIFDYSTTPGANTSVAGINIAEGMPPSNVNNAMRAMMADTKAFQLDNGGAATTGGNGNAYTLASSQSFAAYKDGMRFTARFNRANTGNSSMNVNNVGSAPLRISRGGTYIQLAANDIETTGIYDFVYNEALSGFVLLNITAVRTTDIQINGPAMLGKPTQGLGGASALALGQGLQFVSGGFRVDIGNGTGLNASGIKYDGNNIALQFSTAAQAAESTSQITVMSPARGLEQIRARVGGWEQSTQNVMAQRPAGTVFQNNTGKPIHVNMGAIHGNGSANFQTSNNGSNWLTAVPTIRIAGQDTLIVSLAIAVGQFYRLTGNAEIQYWTELR